MQTLDEQIWRDLLGKPFAENGRGPEAFDCVGLLLEIGRRLGYDLPPWGSDPCELMGAMARWEQVPAGAEQPGDGILLRSNSPDWHVGMVYGGGYMIHAHPSCGVARARYNAFPWHRRIEGFYRWNNSRL